MFFIAAGLHDWMLFGKGFWHNILVWLVVVVVSWQWIWVGSISRGGWVLKCSQVLCSLKAASAIISTF